MSETTRKWQLKLNRNGDKGTIEVGNIKVSVTYVDCIPVTEAWSETHPNLKHEYVNRYRVTCTNKDTGARCSYYFHDSIHNTRTYGVFPEDLGYSILCSIRLDRYYTEDNYPTFESFCAEFGYDTDSRKAEKTYKACINLGERLEKVWDDEALLETLPQ